MLHTFHIFPLLLSKSLVTSVTNMSMSIFINKVPVITCNTHCYAVIVIYVTTTYNINCYTITFFAILKFRNQTHILEWLQTLLSVQNLKHKLQILIWDVMGVLELLW